MGAAATFFTLPGRARAQATTDFNFTLIPANKNLDPSWVASLFAKGTPSVYSGTNLATIGMPIGGICCGQMYLSGDGRLWCWDIFNAPGTAMVSGRNGEHYVTPFSSATPSVSQGFALKINSASGPSYFKLDSSGFANVTFAGQYPIGTVGYSDPTCPVQVTLQAYSPFIPLNADDSGLPATIMEFTLANVSGAAVDLELAGWLQNAVCSVSTTVVGNLRNHFISVADHTCILGSAEAATVGTPRSDIVFADFEGPTYSGLSPAWTTTGTAFGNGPIQAANMPSYQNPSTIGQHGLYLVNSHATAPGSSIAEKDGATGTLTSDSFVISRHFITFLIGGGNHPGQTCMNLLVNGQVVRTATGANNNQLSAASWNVSNLEGQTAQLQIVDNATGGWGNIGIDYIVFTDTPPIGVVAPASAVDYGTMTLSLLNPLGADRASTNAPVDTLPNLFTALEANVTVDIVAAIPQLLVGALSRPLTLPAGGQTTITFVVGWHFPGTQNSNSTVNSGGWTSIQGISTLQRYYAARFADSSAVSAYIAANYPSLSSATHLWRDTWYNSTLPYWFLDRTFANTSILATNTCHRFSNGRFWGWEGVYCCPGTCTHVWQYAQAMARIFPSLERDTRQRVDFGIAFNSSTGMIGFRAENSQSAAVDGQSGTILRAYREHQMSADSTFLTTNWSKIKKAMQWLINTCDANNDGILEGAQPNTLDANWYGKISWLSGLYLASCKACKQMALEMGDTIFASQLDSIATWGTNYINNNLFYHNEYFIQIPDSSGNNVGAAWGCEIDQVFGQSYAFQLGLGQYLDTAKTLSALQRLWKYNFAPDAGGFRLSSSNPVSGGRPYAMPGESGLVMSTFPDPAHTLPTGSIVSSYFNECMTGFEHEVAAHMIWAGMLQEGLAVTRAIHDRYHPSKRNPYNEVECSDHYSRAMASYGTYIAICGYEYHGPKGYLAFSPKLTPENFQAAFTAAEGWGSFTQLRTYTKQIHSIVMMQGQLRLSTFAFDVAASAQTGPLNVTLGNTPVAATSRMSGSRVTVSFSSQVIVPAGQTLTIQIGSFVDTDGNGLPDAWEMNYFGHIGVDPTADPDGDGTSNHTEFVAGTNPIDATSVLRISGVTPVANGFQIAWSSVPGMTYTLECTNDLAAPWQTLQSHIPASPGAVTTFVDTSAGSQTQRFYRVTAEGN